MFCFGVFFWKGSFFPNVSTDQKHSHGESGFPDVPWSLWVLSQLIMRIIKGLLFVFHCPRAPEEPLSGRQQNLETKPVEKEQRRVRPRPTRQFWSIVSKGMIGSQSQRSPRNQLGTWCKLTSAYFWHVVLNSAEANPPTMKGRVSILSLCHRSDAGALRQLSSEAFHWAYGWMLAAAGAAQRWWWGGWWWFWCLAMNWGVIRLSIPIRIFGHTCDQFWPTSMQCVCVCVCVCVSPLVNFMSWESSKNQVRRIFFSVSRHGNVTLCQCGVWTRVRTNVYESGLYKMKINENAP